MAKSLPSTRTIFVDVPEVKNFQGEFVYNFFEPDERINDSGKSAPNFIRKRSSESFDANFIESANFNRFAARYIKLEWRPVAEGLRFVSKEFRIADNLSKIHLEEDFIAEDFTGIKLQDTGIDEKIKYLVKKMAKESLRVERSIAVKENLPLGESFRDRPVVKIQSASSKSKVISGRKDSAIKVIKPVEKKSTKKPVTSKKNTSIITKQAVRSASKKPSKKRNKKEILKTESQLKEVLAQIRKKSYSPQQLAKYVNKKISKEVDPLLITESLTDLNKDGVIFRDSNGNEIKKKSLISDLKNVRQLLQINNRFLHKTLETIKENGFTIFTDEIDTLLEEARAIEKDSKGKDPSTLAGNDYDFEIEEFVGYKYVDPDAYEPKKEILGFIIEKTEMNENGEFSIKHDPIILESSRNNTFADTKIKYGATYSYNIRSIALVEAQAEETESGDLVVLQFMVSSKPSESIEITCEEVIPPPPPADFSVHWDRSSESALLTWSFPVNTQRDIKQWQIFRRSSIEEPFELIQLFDFNDAVVPEPNGFPENPDKVLVEYLDGPQNFFYDFEFTKDSSYIYAICSVDAHGFSSGYSIQIECSFDKFHNKLEQTLISPSGAPKAYPNIHLYSDTFVDTIRDSGHKGFQIIFDPEYLEVTDSEGSDLKLLRTDEDSFYKMNIINVDLQEQKNVEIRLVDNRTSSYKNKERLSKRLFRSKGKVQSAARKISKSNRGI